MDVDHILKVLNRHRVEYILIGGMNYLLRHQPVLTYDVDIWIRDSASNRRRSEKALAFLGCEWGPTVAEWRAVGLLPSGWLDRQGVFSLTSDFGAVDVFRSVMGLDSWMESRARAYRGRTSGGASFWGLSDIDMLASQNALPPRLRKKDRVSHLRAQARRTRA